MVFILIVIYYFQVRLNCQQLRICQLEVNGVGVHFQYLDPSLDLTQKCQQLSLESLALSHMGAVESVDPQVGDLQFCFLQFINFYLISQIFCMKIFVFTICLEVVCLSVYFCLIFIIFFVLMFRKLALSLKINTVLLI